MSAAASGLARRLRAVEVFSDLADAQLAWLAEHATIVELATGEVLRHEGDPADVMLAVLDGEMRSRQERGDSDGRLFVRRTGQVGGMLPNSRLTHFPVTIRAARPTTLACFDVALFPAMREVVPVLEARLAAAMIDRAKENTHFEQHREHLAGLGKLAAGLAHELNNPMAAIQRTTGELGRVTAVLEDVGHGLWVDALGASAQPRFEALNRGQPTTALAASDRLALSDAEDEIATVLARLGVADGWRLAGDLVASGLRAPDLEEAVAGLTPRDVERLVAWRTATYAAAALQTELATAAERVVELIAAVKGFSQLDRAVAASDVDVREGLASTLAVLSHVLRERHVSVREEHADGLPRVRGLAVELNQVWLNLLDNAADAARDGGTITLRTHFHASEVLVEVEDDGAGIPDDVVWRVFEPFFTTKPVGQGTGLGLELVRRIVMAHGGDVHVESVPGRTVFQVRLPAATDASRPAPG